MHAYVHTYTHAYMYTYMHTWHVVPMPVASRKGCEWQGFIASAK